MIFPREEKLKYEKLQAKLGRLNASCKKMDIFTSYSNKFETIVLCASQKLILRTEKIKLPEGEFYGGHTFSLTGSGIRQHYGYEGHHRRPEGNWLHFLINGPHYESLQNKKWLADLSKQWDEIKKIAKDPTTVDNLKQVLEDIRSTHFFGSNYNVNLRHEEKVALGTPIEIQGSEGMEEGKGENDSDHTFTATRLVVELNDCDISISLEKNKASNVCFQIDERLMLSDYIRISEPDTYDAITKLIDELILKVDTKVAAKTKALDAVVQKYGQYICYKEL